MSETYRSWSTRSLESLALDPEPQRVHDSDGACTRCGCLDFSLETDECQRCGKVPIPFEPWHKDVYALARLLRWLELVDEVPRDIPLYLETALSWSDAYDRMNEAIGK